MEAFGSRLTRLVNTLHWKLGAAVKLFEHSRRRTACALKPLDLGPQFGLQEGGRKKFTDHDWAICRVFSAGAACESQSGFP
jgi:hypothetical protein